MSGTLTGLNIRQRLLSGALDASGLQAELGTASNLAAFTAMISDGISARLLMENDNGFTAIAGSTLALAELVKSSAAMKAVAGSDLATEKITGNSTALKAVLTNINSFFAYIIYSENKARMQRRVNASDSKLKRAVFKTSGTFVIPGSGLAAMSVAAIGGGGGGGGGVSRLPGGGGEYASKMITSSLPSSNQTVTVGGGGSGNDGVASAGGSSSIGSIITAAGGGHGAGGGTTTAAGKSLATVTDFDNEFWYFYDVKIKGAEPYENGLIGQAGSNGISATGISSGGGIDSSGPGKDASGIGCGGNATDADGSEEGGDGSAGRVSVCYIEN